MSGGAAKSAARRKRAERERRRKAGYVLRQIWVRPTDWPRVKQYLDALEEPVVSGPSEADRLQGEERALRDSITSFRAGDPLPREALHDRHR